MFLSDQPAWNKEGRFRCRTCAVSASTCPRRRAAPRKRPSIPRRNYRERAAEDVVARAAIRREIEKSPRRNASPRGGLRRGLKYSPGWARAHAAPARDGPSAREAALSDRGGAFIGGSGGPLEPDWPDRRSVSRARHTPPRRTREKGRSGAPDGRACRPPPPRSCPAGRRLLSTP